MSVFVISTHLLVVNYIFFLFAAKTPICPGFSLTNGNSSSELSKRLPSQVLSLVKPPNTKFSTYRLYIFCSQVFCNHIFCSDFILLFQIYFYNENLRNNDYEQKRHIFLTALIWNLRSQLLRKILLFLYSSCHISFQHHPPFSLLLLDLNREQKALLFPTKKYSLIKLSLQLSKFSNFP